MNDIKFLLREEREKFLLFNSQRGTDLVLLPDEVEELKKGVITEKLSNFGFNKKNIDNIREISVIRKSNPKRISFPKRLILDLSNECQIKCFYCYMGFDKIPKFMPTDFAIDMIDKSSELGTFEIRFSGGEPLLHRDLDKIAKHAKSLGLFVSITTNGGYELDKLKKVENYIDKFHISTHGIIQIDNSPNIKFYELAKEKMRYLRDKNKSFRINSILPKVDGSYLEKLVELADEVSSDINFFIYRPFGRNSDLKEVRDLAPNLDEWLNYLKKLEKLKKNFPKVNITTNNYDVLQKKGIERFRLLMDFNNCPTSEEFFTITPNGDIYSCGFMYYHDSEKFKIGNAKIDNLWDLWSNDSKWGIFRESDDFSVCLSCHHFQRQVCYGSCVAESYFSEKYLDLREKYICNLSNIK